MVHQYCVIAVYCTIVIFGCSTAYHDKSVSFAAFLLITIPAKQHNRPDVLKAKKIEMFLSFSLWHCYHFAVFFFCKSRRVFLDAFFLSVKVEEKRNSCFVMSTGGFSLMVDNSHDKLCPVMVPILDNRAPATEQSSP